MEKGEVKGKDGKDGKRGRRKGRKEGKEGIEREVKGGAWKEEGKGLSMIIE